MAYRSTLEEGLLTLLGVNGGSSFGFFDLGDCECWLISALLGVDCDCLLKSASTDVSNVDSSNRGR